MVSIKMKRKRKEIIRAKLKGTFPETVERMVKKHGHNGREFGEKEILLLYFDGKNCNEQNSKVRMDIVSYSSQLFSPPIIW